jgi:hypothetical protein
MAGILLAGAVAAGQGPDAATRPAGGAGPEAGVDTQWRVMLAQFASEDFREREAAQKTLETTTWRDYDLLRRLATMTRDAEAKARVEGRLQTLVEKMAVEPPPLTLQIKDKPLDDVAAALAGLLNVKVEAWPTSRAARTGKSFTLDVMEKPLWDVMLELNRQHPISLQQSTEGLRLMQTEPGTRHGVVSGGLLVYPMSITRSKTVALQKPEGEQVGAEQMNFTFTAILDPRVKLVKYRQPELTEVLDDAGNVLHRSVEVQRPEAWSNDHGRMRIWQSGVALKIPEKMGKKIVSAKGELRIIAQVDETLLEIPDAVKTLNQPVTIGGMQVTIEQLELRGTSIQFRVTRKQLPAVERDLGADLRLRAAAENPGVRITFMDATNRRIWSSMVLGSSGGSFSTGGEVKPPIKVELSMATKTKEVGLPFEMKNLPLP